MTFKPHSGHVRLALKYADGGNSDPKDVNSWTRRDLLDNEILQENKGYSDAQYVLTDLGRVWVDRILKTPLPKKVIRYE